MSKETVPPDLDQCQCERPSTWPQMPSFMTFGPVSFKRCENPPTWVASNGKGAMSLCDECKEVMDRVFEGDRIETMSKEEWFREFEHLEAEHPEKSDEELADLVHEKMVDRFTTKADMLLDAEKEGLHDPTNRRL